MTAKGPQGKADFKRPICCPCFNECAPQWAPCCSAAVCTQEEDQRTDRPAGAQQSLHVTLEDKILSVMLRKIGRGERPLLPKNRKRLCFLGAWLGAALQHILGRLFPTKEVFCLVPCLQWDMEEVMGSSALLESISRLIPLNAIGFPCQAWQVVYPNQAQKVPPFTLQLACLGCCFLLPFACFSQSSQMPVLVSRCFPLVLTLPGSFPHNIGVKIPTIGASGLPWDLHGGQDSTFVPSYKVPFSCSEERKTRAGASPASALQSLS